MDDVYLFWAYYQAFFIDFSGLNRVTSGWK